MDEQGGTLLTITDEEGNEYVLEHLDTIEMDGRFFLAFLPADMDPEDEEYGMVLMEAFPGEGDGASSVRRDRERGRAWR